jgi:outer membrane biosynthesis protein TonB
MNMNEKERNRRLIINTIAVVALLIGAGLTLYFLTFGRKKEEPTPKPVPEITKEAPKQEAPPEEKPPEEKKPEEKPPVTTPKEIPKQQKTPTGKSVPVSGPSIPEPFPY